MLHIVGAGSGAADLITVRGKALLESADVIIYAGSLVNPELLDYAKEGAKVYNSAEMDLGEVIAAITEAEGLGLTTVRLHTGDPSLYGAIAEQIAACDELGIEVDVTPGVSSFLAAAAAMKAEYTLPGVTQTVILTRMQGRTAVPEKESIESLARHGASMAIFLSTGMLGELSERLIQGGYAADSSAAIVYKASWPDEAVYRCSVADLEKTAKENGVEMTALVLVGGFLSEPFELSKLYSPDFSHAYRKAKS
ncbi:MAG: precorrin-4 C(11)-methyltransferase [Eubacteriaceae bacterium]|nr:precorrin-4 C(11)-methyltransferase [Eubacteriaceae bacterium]